MMTVLATAALFANLLANPGFEGKTGWSEAKAGYSIVGGQGQNGTRCALFDVKKDTPYFVASHKFAGEELKDYRVEAWIRTEDLKGGGAHVGVEFYGKGRKYLCGSYSPKQSGTSGWKKVEIVGEAPEGTVESSVCIFVDRNSEGRAWFDDLVVEPSDRAALAAVRSSAYRDTAVGGKVRFCAVVDLPAKAVAERGLKGWFDLPSDRGAPRTVAAEIRDGGMSAETDVASLPLGRATVVARLSDATGANVESRALVFTRTAKPVARRVSFDARRRTLVGGRKFFPLGVYVSQADAATLRDFEGTPFNCILPYTRMTRAQLDACAKQGLYGIAAVNTWHYGYGGCPASITCVDDEAKAVRAYVDGLKDHPALLAWYVCDELGTEMVPRLTARYDVLKELDPDHPNYFVHYRIELLQRFIETFDVIGTDPYPVCKRDNPPFSQPVEWTRLTEKAVFGGMPVWQVPQIFDWGGYNGGHPERTRAPTFEEMRNMTHQCLAEGAQGLVFWAHLAVKQMVWRDPFAKRWADIVRMADEVKAKIPLYLSDDPAPSVRVSNGKVSARAWRMGTSVETLVVNPTHERQSVTVETDGVGRETLTLEPIEVRWLKKDMAR